jgi:nucleoside phosphorylase
MKEKPIAVFTALRWEGEAVLSALNGVSRSGERVWRGYTGEQEVLVIVGGIGPRRAQRAVESFTTTPLRAVISAGCAGALRAGPRGGELTVAPEVRMYQQGALQSFPVDMDLLRVAKAASRQAGLFTVDGPLFTSAQVLFTPQEKERCGQQTEAVAVEMESGVHAAFAWHLGLPFLVLRVILDSMDMVIPKIKGLTTPEGEVRSLRAVTHLLAHPQHLSALWHLKSSRTRAATTLRQLFASFFPSLSKTTAC